MVIRLVYVNDFCYYRNCLYTHRYKFNPEKKKKSLRYMVSHPETGSDSPIGSDRESGRDKHLVDFAVLQVGDPFDH